MRHGTEGIKRNWGGVKGNTKKKRKRSKSELSKRKKQTVRGKNSRQERLRNHKKGEGEESHGDQLEMEGGGESRWKSRLVAKFKLTRGGEGGKNGVTRQNRVNREESFQLKHVDIKVDGKPIQKTGVVTRQGVVRVCMVFGEEPKRHQVDTSGQGRETEHDKKQPTLTEKKD